VKRVVGFEGRWPDGSPLAWGAAALADDAGLTNSASGHTSPPTSKTELVASGALSLLPSEIEIRPDFETLPLVVLALRRGHEYFPILVPDTGRLGGIVGTKRGGGASYYVFRDRIAFGQYATDIANRVVGNTLRESPAPEKARDLINAALVLVPTSPYLHALRAFFSSADMARAEAISRAALVGEADVQRFDQLFAALTLTPSAESQYWIKYVDGIAEGGGLDADNAAEQFSAIAKIHRKIRPVLVEETPFFESVDDIPFPRVHELKAASASIGFGIALPDRPLLDRVARYFELQMLQDIVRGNLPRDLQADPDFQVALSGLLNPTPDTRVLQTPLGQMESEPVAFQPPFEAKSARPDAHFRLFGAVEGITKEVRRAELKFSPAVRESVSTADDGEGRAPEGNDLFQRQNDFLFRAAIFGVSRYVDQNRRYRFYLKSCQMLSAGDTATIDAVPSSVVIGAFLLLPSPIAVSATSGGSVTIAGSPIGSTQRPNVTTMGRLLLDFESWARDIEIAVAEKGQGKWVRPIHPRRPSALLRLMIALGARGGSAVVSDVIADVNQIFDTSVRRNNTFREINRNPDLLATDEEDDETIRLTPRGRLLIGIYKEAGGDLGRLAPSA
jgi:hypothetical protein